MKKLVLLSLWVGIVLFAPSCSTKKAAEEDMSEAEASEIISEEGSDISDDLADASQEATQASDTSDLTSTTGKADELASTEGDSIITSDDTSSDNQDSLDSLSSSNSGSELAQSNSGEAIPEPSGVVPTVKSSDPDTTDLGGAEPTVAKTSPPPPANPMAPKIPGKAVEKNGSKLNRFYFVRKADDPKKVSTLLYGDKSKAKALQAWNPGSWKAGKLLFYASPINPSDDRMQSFYQERSIPFEPHNIAEGETLYSIAKAKLGDSGSWKEIAVLNGIDRAKNFEVGQKVEINPLDLASVASPIAVPGATPTKEEPKAEIAQRPEPEQVSPPPPAEQTPPPKKAAPVAEDLSEEGGIAELISHNVLPLTIGGAAIVLLLLLAAVSKRKQKKPAGDDFNEEGFSAPPKLKKRK